MKWSTAVTFLLFFVRFEIGTVKAQVPAFLSGGMAVRYEEAPGYFHYVFPCKMPLGNSPHAGSTPSPATDTVPALCWPALMAQAKMANGSAKSTVPVAGVLMVSASLVRFVPNDPKNTSLIPDAPSKDTVFQYDAPHAVAALRTKEGTYGFAFQSICLGCTPGTSPIDTKKSAQLEGEYRDFKESLTQFDTVSRHINDIAARIRVGVTLKNQPTVSDPPEAMALFSDLNQRFAEFCVEPDKSCVRNYAKYQACKSASSSADCGDPPACSAFCTLTSEALRGLKAGLCTSKLLDSGALIPDWSEAAKKMDAAREAKGVIDQKTIQINAAPPGPPRDFMGKPIEPDNPCSVESGYANAMMAHMVAKGGTHTSSFNPTLVDGKLSVPFGMIGNRISGMTPEYPAVARAAHIEGAVVLQATLSRQGAIENLRVLSGPQLLRQATLDAVKTWQYPPYLFKGEPIEVETQITVNFSLGGQGPGQQPENTRPN